jgi:hypothetical protein
VALAAGIFGTISSFRRAHFADFGKSETSFGNLGGSHWRSAVFVVSFGHDHKK